MAKKKTKRSAKRKKNTRRKVVKTPGGAHVGKALAKERATVARLRKDLERAKKKTNPRRPPHAWWQACLSSVEAQRHARDPAAVCGAAWWKKPAHERAAIVHRLERGSPRARRQAVALAKAERNRARPGKSKRPRHTSAHNPPRELVKLVYLEQKPGDTEPWEYEHDFEGKLPRLAMRGGRLQVMGGSYRTKDGWIRG